MLDSEGVAAGGRKALALLRGDDPAATITHSDTGDYRFVNAGLLAPYAAPTRVATVKCGYGSLCRVDIQPLVPGAGGSAGTSVAPPLPLAGSGPRLAAIGPSGAPLLIQCWAGDVSKGVDHMPAAAAAAPAAAGAASTAAGSADGITAGDAAEAAAAAAASTAASTMALTVLPSADLAIVAAPALDPEQVELW